MLTQIHIENLKCFEALKLPLAPLTLLSGFNAAGKSTALQALFLIGQAARLDGQTPWVPLNGSLVRLGTPGDVLNEQSDRTEVLVGVSSSEAHAMWRLNAQDRRSTTSLVIDWLSWQLAGQPRSEIDVSPHTYLKNLLIRDAQQLRPVNDLVEALKTMIVLSAVRAGTYDTFPSPEGSAPVHADVGVEGQYAPWWFERLGDEDVDEARCHDNAKAAPVMRRQFIAWAGDLFPGTQANVQRIAKTPLVRLELRNCSTGEWRRPANIGYGLVYAFPILVAALLAKPDQILVIDSPEAHLHPKAQSAMGRFLAQIAAAGVQILIETHSDHVLNGVRIALKQRRVRPENVAVHFFNPPPASRSDRAHVHSPVVDQDGNMSEWPDGFFDQAEHDLEQLMGWR